MSARQDAAWIEYRDRMWAEGKCESSGLAWRSCANGPCDCPLEGWTNEQIAEFAKHPTEVDMSAVARAGWDGWGEMLEGRRTALAQRDTARDIAARLEGELARVREIVTAWSLGETHRDEMVLWAIRDIVGLTPAKPDNPTPWPHPDAVIAEGES